MTIVACKTGKIQHATRDDALQHQKNLVYTNHAQGESERSKGLNVYPCDQCSAWHVGHDESSPAVYHYTLMRHLDAILSSDALKPAEARFADRDWLRNLPPDRRAAALAVREPEPLLWFSRNAVWEYSVIKGYQEKKPRGHRSAELVLRQRSELEMAGGGLLRFVVPAWCAKLRWSDYLAKNTTPAWLRDGMARDGDPTEWLCTDEAVPLNRVRAIDVFYRGTWTPVDSVAEEDFDTYLAERPKVYQAAGDVVNLAAKKLVNGEPTPPLDIDAQMILRDGTVIRLRDAETDAVRAFLLDVEARLLSVK